MFSMRYAAEKDKQCYLSVDKHLPESEFESKIRDKRCYILENDGKMIGVMRYNLFWDTIPFLTQIYLMDGFRGKGFGRQAMVLWEDEMRALGHRMVMTSTQVDEQAQKFYRKLGYKDRGGLFLDGTPFEQPQELLMVKALV